MSLETQIAELTAAASALVEMFKTKKADIDKAVATALATVPLMRRVYFVDAVAGNDEADGMQATPFQTFKRAVDGVPLGGYGIINVIAGQTHEMLANVDATQKQIEVRAYGAGTMPVLRSNMWMSGAVQAAASIDLRGLPMAMVGVRLVTAKDLGNGAAISTFHSFITRSTGRSAALHLANCEVELRDGSIMCGGSAGDVKLVAASCPVVKTGTGRLIDLFGGIGQLSVTSVTLPAGITLAELVGGIVRDTANTPRNLLCNVVL